MARVLLIIPQLPQRMGAPYLGLQYVASALLRSGHEVRCLDLAALHAPVSAQGAVEIAERFDADVIGFTLFTYNALNGYRLASALQHLRGRLVAGGPHTTTCPQEALEHGFEAAIIGEGEHALVALVNAVQQEQWPRPIPGVQTRAGITAGGFIEDLDALPWPLDSYECFDPLWYGQHNSVVPGGMMTSRGCPAKCTFCANHVTGRSFRWRSAADVVGEMQQLRERFGLNHFAFWDDAFTANRQRLKRLCDAIDAELPGATWSCITPASMTTTSILERMAASGCVAINFGIESGDPQTLRAIAKGQRPKQVVTAVQTASSLGMSTVVNFMFGFPGESVESLQTTRQLMEVLADDVDWFNHRGVLVPFPGTPIYERHHVEHGFTKWWLRDAYVGEEPNLFGLDPREAMTSLEHDPTLDLDFFHYSKPTREAIAACVRFKARHNANRVEALSAAAGGSQPIQTQAGAA